MSGSELLSVSNLHCRYGAVRAVRDVSLTVNEGEFVVLLGPNGAGKSTLIKSLSGLVPAASGTIAFAGRTITRLAGWRRTGLGLSQVPEGRQIFPDHTVEENLLLGGFVHRRNQRRVEANVVEMYDIFPRLGERRTQLAGTLSGGEAQMLAVARALMSTPRLLMLDEPSLGLAPMKVVELFDYLRMLHQERGLAILLVEQQAATALRLADRGYVLHGGHITLAGSAAELRDDPQVRAAYLGG